MVRLGLLRGGCNARLGITSSRSLVNMETEHLRGGKMGTPYQGTPKNIVAI